MLGIFPRMLDFKPLYKKKDEFSVGYTRYRFLDNLPPREFVTVTGGGLDGHKVVINSVEVNYPHTAVQGAVRGEVITAGCILFGYHQLFESGIELIKIQPITFAL